MQQLAVYILFRCRISLHVSGAVCTHHQEYLKLHVQPLVQCDAQCKVPPTNDYLIPELTYHILWFVPVVAHAVLSTPDDGCKELSKHVERSCSEIKYRLLTAASRWKLTYIKLFTPSFRGSVWMSYFISYLCCIKGTQAPWSLWCTGTDYCQMCINFTFEWQSSVP
jgi:hypothetical protein